MARRRGSAPLSRGAAIAAGCIAFAAIAAAAPCAAQISARTLTLAGLNDCIAEAIAAKGVEDDGAVVIFSCTASTARTLYNFLGKKVRAEVVEDRNGKFENRAFGNSACYHRIEDAAGRPADEFRCDLVMAVGEALGE
jgi:hypothetical protein